MKLKKRYTKVTAKEIEIESEYRQCEAENCWKKFLIKWHTQRRCDRCRREKRPYRIEDHPF